MKAEEWDFPQRASAAGNKLISREEEGQGWQGAHSYLIGNDISELLEESNDCSSPSSTFWDI